jgi:hypothetical protein
MKQAEQTVNKLQLIEGNASTTRIKYSYRGHIITGRYGGSSSSRTVTKGREWFIGGGGRRFSTLRDAKAEIDIRLEEAA